MHRVQACRKEENSILSSAVGPFTTASPQIRAGQTLDPPRIGDNFMNKQRNDTASNKCVVPHPCEPAVDRKFSSTFASFAVAKIPFLSIKVFPRLLGGQIFQGHLNVTVGRAC